MRTGGLTGLLQRSIVLSAALATLLFALPLAWTVQGIYTAEASADLAGQAEKWRTLLTPQGRHSPDQVRGTTITQPEHGELGIYDKQGVLLTGVGPQPPEDLVRRVAKDGVEADGVSGAQQIVAVPIPNRDGGLVVRAAQPVALVQRRVYTTWLLMAGLAGAVLIVVAGVARARARRIARPLQRLAAAAQALGHGDFSIRATRSGITEVDAVSTSLESTARRLGGMLDRERSFSADASHQMRTPLTALRLGLEAALITPGADLRAAVDDALLGLDRLEQTVIDLLHLARDTTNAKAVTDVAAVVREIGEPWAVMLRDRGRRLEISGESDLPPSRVSGPALRTVLDVLMGNAMTHGAGTVTVRLSGAEGVSLVEVSDTGAGITRDPAGIFQRRSAEAKGTGIGLALARSLIEADGGRLELTRVRPAAFTVVLPQVIGAGASTVATFGTVAAFGGDPTPAPEPMVLTPADT